MKHERRPIHSAGKNRLFCVLFCILHSAICLCFLPGCNVLGVAAQALPAATVTPRYTGLTNQSVAVMVWVDPAVDIDRPSLGRDIAATVQNKLKISKAKELTGVTFPWPADSIIRFQQDHPEIDAMPIVNVAPRISGITRLIYIEIEGFSTRSEMSAEMYRGTMSATVKVVEIADGKATIAYEESDVRVAFPPKGRPEGIPGGDNPRMDARIYLGTVDEFTTAVVNWFVPHEEER